MIRIKPFGNRDAKAVHVDASNEFSVIPEINTLEGGEVFILEWPNETYAKRKIQASNINLPGTDTTAFHTDKTGEILSLEQKNTPVDGDILVIEDSAASYGKKYVTIADLTPTVGGDISIDTIADGTIFKKMTAIEQTKLSNIEDYADVTDIQNVTTAENSINVNEHADITSPGADIEDAVVKRHLQGTDNSLGILSTDIDMGGYKIVNTIDPINDYDGATKHYIDNRTLDDILDGITYKKIPSADATKLSSITSSAVDIDDAVTKKHTQGTDTTLGVLTANVDMGTFRVTNSVDPIDTYDLATKNYVDNASYQDSTAIHKNIANEINVITQKPLIMSNDTFLIEDSEDSFNKKSVLLSQINANLNFDAIQDGTTYTKVLSSDATKLSSITSSAIDIDDAVAKKHTQGTDTTLGYMTADIQMQNHLIRGLQDPIYAQDACTFFFADRLNGSANQLPENKSYQYSSANNEYPLNFTPELKYTCPTDVIITDYTTLSDGTHIILAPEVSGGTSIIRVPLLTRFKTLHVVDYVPGSSASTIHSAVISGSERVFIGMTGTSGIQTSLIYSNDMGITFAYGMSIGTTDTIDCFFSIPSEESMLMGGESNEGTPAHIFKQTTLIDTTLLYTAPSGYNKVGKFLAVDDDIWCFINDNVGYNTLIVKSSDNGSTWTTVKNINIGEIAEVNYLGTGIFVMSISLGSAGTPFLCKTDDYFNYITYEKYYSTNDIAGVATSLTNLGKGRAIAGFGVGSGNCQFSITNDFGRSWSDSSLIFPGDTQIAIVIPNNDGSVYFGNNYTNTIYRYAISQPVYKSHFIPSYTSLTFGNYRVQPVYTVGSANFNWMLPSDFNGFGPEGGAYLIGIVESGAAQYFRNIDLSIQYSNGTGTDYDSFSASDTTTTYDLHSSADCIYKFPFHQLITLPYRDTMGGLTVTHNTIGGTIDYLGIEVIYY